MSYTCLCGNNQYVETDNYMSCQAYCASQGGVMNYSSNELANSSNTIFGINNNNYFYIVAIEIIFWILLLICCLGVLRVSGPGRPRWLQPTLITLLVLWIIFCWYPIVGVCIFALIIIILGVFFFSTCNRRNCSLEYNSSSIADISLNQFANDY